MATLNNADYKEIRAAFYRMGFGKEEFQALSGGMPNQAQLLAGLQAIEDFMVGNFATMKSNMDTALTRTTTNPGAQKIVAAYLRWKINELLGV